MKYKLGNNSLQCHAPYGIYTFVRQMAREAILFHSVCTLQQTFCLLLSFHLNSAGADEGYDQDAEKGDALT